MIKHPLDAVESALVDASNALNDVDTDDKQFALTLLRIDADIDNTLRFVQATIHRDLDPPDPRD